MSNSFAITVPDSILSPVSSMTNADLPSDAQWKAAARETGNSGRFLMNQTIRDDGYALIQFVLDADPGIAKWCADIKRDHTDAIPIISIVAGTNQIDVHCNALIGNVGRENMTTESAMDVLRALGKSNPSVSKEKVDGMTPEVVSVYGIFGTLSYCGLIGKESGSLLKVMKSDYKNALAVAFGHTSVIVSLCLETNGGEDVSLLGLADYVLSEGRFHHVVVQ